MRENKELANKRIGCCYEVCYRVDLGTSAVKIHLVNRGGDVVQEVSKPLPLIQEKVGYSEQNPS